MRETASSSTAVPGDSAGVPGTNPSGRWQFSLDRGGTFTDVIGINPGGRLHTAKLLSDSPAYPDAAIEGIRRLLDLPPGAPVPEDRVGGPVSDGYYGSHQRSVERLWCQYEEAAAGFLFCPFYLEEIFREISPFELVVEHKSPLSGSFCLIKDFFRDD